MSSALVRQALEFVDPEENDEGKRGRRRKGQPRRLGAPGQQDRVEPYKRNKKPEPKGNKKPEPKATASDAGEENVKKLLALSAPAVDSSNIIDQIIERAIKGKPLTSKIEVKKDDGKSILFPD